MNNKLISEIKAERDKLDKALSILQDGSNVVTISQPKKKRRTMSPEVRKRLSDAMKARWAERKKPVQKAA